MATVTMPQLGETVVEGTITKWLKGPGDQVERDEPLFEISTDKVDTEVPSPVAGTLKDILVQEGETVKVGTDLATIDEDGGGSAAEEEGGEAEAGEPEEAPGQKAEAEAAEQQEQAAAEEDRAGEDRETDQAQSEPAEPPQRREAPQPQAAPTRPEPAPSRQEERRPVSAPAGRGPRSHILSPLVRRLAEENNIDLSQVEGTGTGGRITKKDITSFIESGGAQKPALRAVPEAGAAPARAPQQIPAGEAEQTVKISHIRKRIAENMVASLQTTARAWNLVEVNMENIVRLRTRVKDRFKAEEGINLTYMPFVARAVCDSLIAFPDVNAKLDLEAGTATYRRYVNLGVAVAYEDGLIVPVVHGAEEMNLVGLARAINDVGTRARAKRLKPDEVHGGTFTITNPGPFGSIISVPIMNPGETAILAFDAIEKRPVVIDDAIAIRHMVYLSLSWDHRMIDGATAAQFLGRLKQNLEEWDFTPELQAYLEE
jgi:pyruvate dehydrogenase E2 component (dihydrolipoamide acetyltransferase)